MINKINPIHAKNFMLFGVATIVFASLISCGNTSSHPVYKAPDPSSNSPVPPRPIPPSIPFSASDEDIKACLLKQFNKTESGSKLVPFFSFYQAYFDCDGPKKRETFASICTSLLQGKITRDGFVELK